MDNSSKPEQKTPTGSNIHWTPWGDYDVKNNQIVSALHSEGWEENITWDPENELGHTTENVPFGHLPNESAPNQSKFQKAAHQGIRTLGEGIVNARRFIAPGNRSAGADSDPERLVNNSDAANKAGSNAINTVGRMAKKVINSPVTQMGVQIIPGGSLLAMSQVVKNKKAKQKSKESRENS